MRDITANDWCVHYRGLHHKVCKSGVAYADVRADVSGPLPYPCFRDRSEITTCAKRRFMTAEEAAADEAKTQAAIRAHLDKLASGICPDCDTPIAKKVQVGRCVYADPCGHRLYQGSAT